MDDHAGGGGFVLTTFRPSSLPHTTNPGLLIMYIFILLVAFALLLTGCSDSQPSGTLPSHAPVSQSAADAVRKSLDGHVKIDIKITELPGRLVRIHGTTNLPEGTELMLSIEGRFKGEFDGQSKSSVQADGTFQSESFGPQQRTKGGHIRCKGTHANFSCPARSRQANCRGKRRKADWSACSKLGKPGVTVSASQEFTIGGANIAGSRTTSHRASQGVPRPTEQDIRLA